MTDKMIPKPKLKILGKRCSRCQEYKDINEFSQHNSSSDGFSTLCKACVDNHLGKRCSKCQEYKDINEFSRYGRSKDGFSPLCEDCANKYFGKYFSRESSRRYRNSSKRYRNSSKRCGKCREWKPAEDFHKNGSNGDGLERCCKACRKEELTTYYRTKKGLATKIYYQQKASSKRRGHTPPEYSKRELREWIFSQSKFDKLYVAWVKSGYETDLRPSVDRLEEDTGYRFDNIQLVTWFINQEIFRMKRMYGLTTKSIKAVNQYDRDGRLIITYYSIEEAARETGIHRGSIGTCCNGKQKTAGGFRWSFV